MKAYSRGVALPETALVIGFAMLLIFGITELALLAYTEASAEGAAFIGGHQVAINASGDATTDKTTFMNAIASPFPRIHSGDVTLSYPSGNVQVVVRKDVPGIYPLGGGAMPTFSIYGMHIEPMSAPSPNPTPQSLFAVRATLANYCYYTGTGSATRCDATHPLYIAQYDNLNNTGGGSSGQLGEWKCRQNLFPDYGGGSGQYFPAAYPTGKGGKGTTYDPSPSNSKFGEKSLYAFDSQYSLWGVQASC